MRAGVAQEIREIRAGGARERLETEKFFFVKVLKQERNESRLFVIQLPEEAKQLVIKLPKKARLYLKPQNESRNLLSIHLSDWLYMKPQIELTNLLSVHLLRLY